MYKNSSNLLGQTLEYFRRYFYMFWSNLFIIQLTYFVSMSLLGYLVLSALSMTTSSTLAKPKMFDLFFTSVSATTVSSMSSVEMEVFSNSQLIILTFLMLFGGEIFISIIGIQIHGSNFFTHQTHDQISRISRVDCQKLNQISFNSHSPLENEIICSTPQLETDTVTNNQYLKYKSIRYLRFVVLGYFLMAHIVGSSLIYSYIVLFPFASRILNSKGIKKETFSIFTVVSTFANCGFVPTNENMVVFKTCSGLLLLLIVQTLIGNTLYPCCLWVVIWILGKITKKREFIYLLRNHREIGYDHLFSGYHSASLFLTVLVFILVQMILFCAMDWRSEAMKSMSSYQKLVASLFQVVNSRHTGESSFDLSTISSAILVLFVVMMYLPPYLSFIPNTEQESGSMNGDKPRKTIFECFSLSQLSYLAIFVILICITEREKMRNDPLNFSVLNIIIEVTSAYGNVGFSAGYSCKRQLNPTDECIDKWFGSVGKWSPQGKCILIIVMFLGRLKKFSLNNNGGKAWKTL